MIKTNPKSWFAHKSLDQIQRFDGVVLQVEKTDSTYEGSGDACYLCELVDRRHHSTRSIEELAEEVLRQNKEIRQLRNKIDRQQKIIQQLE